MVPLAPSLSERLGRVLLTSLILLATGMAALVANSPNDRDIDVEISYADLDRIREDVSREWSTKAIYRNECGMFRDSSDKNIMYVYMMNPDWVEAQRIYRDIYWGGRHRVIPVKCNYSMNQLRMWLTMADQGLHATGIAGYGSLRLRDNRFELTVRHRQYMDDSIRVLQRLEIPNDAALLRAIRREFSWPVNLIGFSIFAGLIFLVGVVGPSMVRDETSDGSSSPVHPTDRGLYS